MTELKMTTEWLRAGVTAKPIGVDKENRRINGMVIALEGVLQGDHDGEFDAKTLREIVRLAKLHPKGVKSRFGHPSLSGDGIGSHLGRVTGVRMGEAKITRDGVESTVLAVRGDLLIADSAFQSDGTRGNIGENVLAVAGEDEAAISSSMVLEKEDESRLNKDGSRKLDEQTGEPLPPLWRPTRLHAFDLVDEGGAVDGLISLAAEGLSDEVVRRGCELLDQQFAGKDREFIAARLTGFVERYLGLRFDNHDNPAKTPNAGTLRRRVVCEGRSKPYIGSLAKEIQKP